MYLDVVDLKAFYAERQGRIAARLISAQIGKLWPRVSGDRLLGLGYAIPFLDATGIGAERRLALMPAAQGIVNWPANAPNAAALVRDDMLPLPNGSIDRILAIHYVEHTNDARETLREAWRVLAPAGRILLIVPNRAGMWARAESTPFGHGHPFSRGQLTRLLRDSMFAPIAWSHALALPSVRTRLVVHGGTNWERIGLRLWPGFAGVLMVEATKLVHRPVERRSRLRVARPVLSPALAPSLGMRPRSRA